MAKDFRKTSVPRLPARRAVLKKISGRQKKPALRSRWAWVDRAYIIRLDAKPGRDSELAQLLGAGLRLAQADPSSVSWFALRCGSSSFTLFIAWAEKSDRPPDWQSQLTEILQGEYYELLAATPAFETAEVLAVKLAHWPAESGS